MTGHRHGRPSLLAQATADMQRLHEDGQSATPQFQAFYVRLPSDLHAAVKKRAVEDERTMAQTVRHALRQYVAQERNG